MAQRPLSAPKLTDYPYLDRQIVSAIQIHYAKINRRIRVGDITPEALDEVQDRLKMIGKLAAICSRLRGEYVA